MMKQMAVLTSFLLAGCAPHTGAPDAPRADGAVLSVYTDGETGCQYLGQRSTSAGITPRIAADGKTQMGCIGARLYDQIDRTKG
jgi:hypothetical protein